MSDTSALFRMQPAGRLQHRRLSDADKLGPCISYQMEELPLRLIAWEVEKLSLESAVTSLAAGTETLA